MPVKTIDFEFDGQRRSVTADIPDDASPQEIEQAVMGFMQGQGGGGKTFATAPVGPPTPEGKALSVLNNLWQTTKSTAKDVLSNIPYTGTTPVSLAGPPPVNSAGLQPTDSSKWLPALGAMGAVALGPAGILPAAGAAVVGGGAGEAARQALLALTGGKDAPKTFGEAVGDVAKEGGLQGALQLGGGLAGKLFAPIFKRLTPEGLYQSALKPSLAKSAPNPADVVATGLRERVPVNTAGLEQARNLSSSIGNEIDTGIASRVGTPIDANQVVTRLDDIRKFFANTVNPGTALDEIGQVESGFLASHGPDIPIERAQLLKRNTYKVLDKSYGQLSTANVEAQKQIARGLKEEIENLYPEIKGLNAREAKLIDLEGALERAVAREGNHQITGLGTPVTAGAAYAMTGSPAVARAAAVTRGIFEFPEVKSKLAIALDIARRSKPVRAVGPHVPSLTNTIRLLLPSVR